MNLKTWLQSFGIIAILLTLAPFIAIDYWWISIFDYPHVQLTALTLVAFCIYFIKFNAKDFKDYLFSFLLIACFIFQLLKIYPYTPLAAFEVMDSSQTNGDNTIKLFTVNVLQKNEEKKKLQSEIEKYDADVLLFTETNQRWENDITSIINAEYKYHVEIPLDNTYGMLMYSKFELIDSKIKFIVDDSIPSIHTLVKLPSGDTIQLHAIHPTPPMPQHNMRSTDRDAEMFKVAFESMESKYPVIIAGDFNDVAWSESTSLFQKISGLLDVRKGRGFFNTFNADNIILRWPLDHIFVSEHFRIIGVERGENIDSDHFPMYVNLSLEPEIAHQQKAKEPTEKQIKNARKQIQNEKEQDKE